MRTMTIEEAQARLPELIAGLARGEEIVLTRNAEPVSRLIGPSTNRPGPIFGRGRGKVVLVSEDIDHLQGFEEYME